MQGKMFINVLIQQYSVVECLTVTSSTTLILVQRQSRLVQLWSGLNCVLMGWDFSGQIHFWFEGWCRGLEGEMPGGGVWRPTTLFPLRGTHGGVALWELTMDSWQSGSTLKKKNIVPNLHDIYTSHINFITTHLQQKLIVKKTLRIS